jgi:hypothetical protein
MLLPLCFMDQHNSFAQGSRVVAITSLEHQLEEALNVKLLGLKYEYGAEKYDFANNNARHCAFNADERSLAVAALSLAVLTQEVYSRQRVRVQHPYSGGLYV